MHELTIPQTTDWLTPEWVLSELGEFDLDPCASLNQTKQTAKEYYTVNDNGLMQEWHGRVWMNPPFGEGIVNSWLAKMASHNDGIALIPARVDTKYFHDWIWNRASGLFFFKGRVHFINQGVSKTGAGFPSVLVAYNQDNAEVLSRVTYKGYYVQLR